MKRKFFDYYEVHDDGSEYIVFERCTFVAPCGKWKVGDKVDHIGWDITTGRLQVYATPEDNVPDVIQLVLAVKF